MIIPTILFGLMCSMLVFVVDINDKEEVWFSKNQRLALYTLCFVFGYIIALTMDIFTVG